MACQAKPSQAKPSQAKPSQAKPSQACIVMASEPISIESGGPDLAGSCCGCVAVWPCGCVHAHTCVGEVSVACLKCSVHTIAVHADASSYTTRALSSSGSLAVPRAATGDRRPAWLAACCDWRVFVCLFACLVHWLVGGVSDVGVCMLWCCGAVALGGSVAVLSFS